MEAKADNSLSHIGGISKRERYDWKVVDHPGEFALIDKRQLKVDDSYQRKHSSNKVLKLAAEWSWVACGAISVALREDGEWFVIDGQHRVLGALHRDDITLLPCMVFDTDKVSEEARGFLNANANRKAPTMVDRFKAMLMTEDHAARVVNELVVSTGRTVSAGTHPNHFTAVQVTLRCAREDERALRRIWPVLAEVCTDKRIVQQLIAGLWYLERRLDQGSLGESRWRKRLVQVGYDNLLSAIAMSANFHGGGMGLKNCALGIVQAINKGLRNHIQHSIRTDATNED